ncbi:triple tyrosine motif-containing protein [Bacillus mycoides]|uniref:triple tyrosine motif-containing protein n=1 Tax=Bacillus mycoides TaxID=1405 RepID=UPI0003E1DD88|nr:triple tyrosine motif-containing protein [Bacillus mycoides]ETT85593.1 beta-N-acetylglucosaminidase [Bacillus mycoides FSL H7-687]
MSDKKQKLKGDFYSMIKRFILIFLFFFFFSGSLSVKADSDVISGRFDPKEDIVLQKDTTINGDLIMQSKKKFDLNGHTLTVNGDVSIQNVYSMLLINKGKLIVNGSFYSNSYGYTSMTNDSDYILVQKDFIHNNPLDVNFTAGTLEIKGDFEQKNERGWSFGNFKPSGTHKTIFSGSGVQNIKFATSGYSRFNIVKLTKDASNYKFTDGYCNCEKLIKKVELKSVTVDKEGPQLINTPLTFNAVAEGGENKLYQFWVHDGSGWEIKQAYSEKQTFEWTPTKSGKYIVSVYVKDKDSQKEVDDFKLTSVPIYDESVKMTQVSADLLSPQPKDKLVRITADAVGGLDKNYQFWVHDGFTWELVQDYSSKNTYEWTPVKSGKYRISVYVKDKFSKKFVDDFKIINYEIK